jgi:hypothetical protein
VIATGSRLLRACLLAGVLAATGCRHWGVDLEFDPGYQPAPAIDVAVGEVVDETGGTYDVDVESMMAGELSKALTFSLRYRDQSTPPRKLLLTTQILEYHPGNALKRWIAPGWGASTIRVHCDLEDVAQRDIVGRIDLRKSIEAGGLLSVGGWHRVLEMTAQGIAERIRIEHGIEPNYIESTFKGGPKGGRRR